MYWTYILRSIKYRRALYIGSTSDLSARLTQHNNGKSLHTKKYMPWELVYCEGYANAEDARDREKKLKQFGKVYSQLKRRILRSLQSSTFPTVLHEKHFINHEEVNYQGKVRDQGVEKVRG